jgi:hypothetical protein
MGTRPFLSTSTPVPKSKILMFKKRWLWLGKIVSDEGFEISFAHKSVYYRDSRGKFEFGYESGRLSSIPYQIEGEHVALTQAEIEQMVDRVVRGIESDGTQVDVFSE